MERLSDVLKNLVSVLEREKILYMLNGAVAVSIYGIPRTTQDIDIVIEDSEQAVLRLTEALSKEGFFLDAEKIKNLISISDIIHIYSPDRLFRIDLWIAKRELQKCALSRREKRRIGFVISPIDLICEKLKIGREKDIEDVYGILARQKIDIPQLKDTQRLME